MLKARMFSDYDEALQRRKEVNWVGLGYVRFRHERDCISVMEPEPDKSNLNVLQAHVKGVQSTLYLSIMSTLVSRNLKTSLRQHMKDTHLLTLNIDRDCHIHN